MRILCICHHVAEKQCISKSRQHYVVEKHVVEFPVPLSHMYRAKEGAGLPAGLL